MKHTVLRIFSILLAFAAFFVSVGAATVDDYHFPDDWSHDALVFAVEEGIFVGDEKGELNPTANITRAEMAAVLVRLTGASGKADLSVYRDIEAWQWYCDELSSAVAAGIFNGTSADTMEPKSPLTREQAVVAIARAFGLTAQQRDGWRSFSDAASLHEYARDSLCALTELGAVKGYADGTFRPSSYITRAEIAAVLFQLIDAVADAPEEIPDSGFVLYRGKEPLPNELTLDGTLVITQSARTEFSPTSWTVSEAIIFRTAADTKVDLSNITTKKVVFAPRSGVLSGDAQVVCLVGGDSEYRGSAERLCVVDRVHTVRGDQGDVEVRNGGLVLHGNAESIYLCAHTALTLNGTAQCVHIAGTGICVNGSGYAALLIRSQYGGTCSIAYGTLEDRAYQYDYDHALDTVQTQYIPCTVSSDTTLYASRYLTGYLCTIPKGAVVNIEHNPSGSAVRVTYKDAGGVRHTGWIRNSSCNFIGKDVPTWDSSTDYSVGTKEGFVNTIGYTSKTDCLIWVSRYTQRVIIFRGSAGKWKVENTYLCSTGSNYTPTPTGIFALQAHYGAWYFSDYVVYYPTGYDGDFAFHTTLYGYDGSDYDPTLGAPASLGCVRMARADAAYIYYNIPLGTTVVIW